ncbi:MAG: phycobilisome linker polypeptide [Aulosira sp. ZfuVER01]
MLGQSALTRASSSSSSSRVFVYEVEGLRQNEQTENNKYQIRNSSTILIQVPYNRMNEEMRRITRLGGRIVGIRSASESSTETEAASED